LEFLFVTGTGQKVLVVDLDGTLLRSNMLFESFWSAFGKSWRSPFSAMIALMKGRASLKRHLAEAASIDATTLPYDQKVLAFIEQWRLNEGRAVLVTASDQSFADQIGMHLGVFDEVHGSDGEQNLKSDVKAHFLDRQYGTGAYAYMGDATADLLVWQRAAKAITVNASRSLRQDAERSCANVEHLVTQASSALPYLKALRPHQWLKNALVFLPMLAAHQLDGGTLLASLLVFICFSLVASSVYVLNDLFDLSADRAHPRKRNRPFASGSIPLSHGTLMAVLLIALGVVLAALMGGAFLMVMLCYLGLTTAYSLHLKRRIVVDICVLAVLYTARIVAGGVATGIELSVWLLAFSTFFFLSLAAVKRQAELIDSVARGQLTASGRGYHVDDLPIISMVAICAGYVSVLIMVLYVNSPIVVELYSRPEALWGVGAILLYWITRTVMIAHRGGMHDDPVIFAVKDRVSLFCLLIILMLMLIGAC
jgi:4-hydroxybenzoate polyprenyltransferase/phosphoserine phosphatase